MSGRKAVRGVGDLVEPATLSSLLREVMERMAPSLADKVEPVANPGAKSRAASQKAARASESLPEGCVPPAVAPYDVEHLGQLWQQVVGDPIAGMTRVTRYRGGVLTVEVTAAPLLAELRSFARDDLLHGLHNSGLQGVLDIKFQTASNASGLGS